jgi:hypothetical protein
VSDREVTAVIRRRRDRVVTHRLSFPMMRMYVQYVLDLSIYARAASRRAPPVTRTRPAKPPLASASLILLDFGGRVFLDPMPRVSSDSGNFLARCGRDE